MQVKNVLHKVIDEGRRLSDEEFTFLYAEAELLDLAEAACTVRDRRYPQTVTFIVDRNINFTNVCTCGCKFCAFYRPPGHSEAYLLSGEEIKSKVQYAVEQGATQIMLQGGLHPDLGIEYSRVRWDSQPAGVF